MIYFIGFLAWILIVPAQLIAVHQPEATAAREPQPADVRIDHDILALNQPIRLILLDVLRGTGMHGGFVEMAGCSGLPRGHLQVKQGVTVRQAMDALVAANPSYEWELEGGVVNLRPRGGVPLLRTRIARFQMDATDRELQIVIQDLLRLPEVRQREAALGLKQGMSGGGLSAVEVKPVQKQPVPVHIHLRNVSLQEAFNEVVRASPDGVWIYHENDCNGTKTFTVEVDSDY